MRKIFSLTLVLLLMFALVVPAAAHSVVVLPGSNQNDSVNAQPEDFYFNVGDTANLFLYIVHPADANFAEIGAEFNMTQQVIYPNGTIAPVTLTRSASNVTYDLGNGTEVTTNWYSSNITLDQEGVYYVFSSQKGYDGNVQNRERNSYTVLYAGNSSTGWDNLRNRGLNVGAQVIIHPTTDARNIRTGSSLTLNLTGNVSWFANEVTNASDVLDPVPVIGAVYTNPNAMRTGGPGVDIDTHVRSNAEPTVTFNLSAPGVWTFIVANEDGNIGGDNYQAVYVMPVLSNTTGNGTGNATNNTTNNSTNDDSSIPGIGVIGLIACIGVAGALFMRRKQ